MKYTFYSLFLVFFIYSFLGYLVESTCVSFNKKKIIVSRGFLIGPYLPIFGFGGLLMTLTLEKYRDDLLALFIMSMVICLSIEYFSSYILEKLFKLRWWDYSKKHFNLNGRICLDVGLMFGVAGIISIKFINPIIKHFFSITPINTLKILAIIFAIIISIDFIVSTKTIIKFKNSFTRYAKDSTGEVKSKVLEELSKNSFFTKRLINAFPNAKDKLNKYKEMCDQLYKKIKAK